MEMFLPLGSGFPYLYKTTTSHRLHHAFHFSHSLLKFTSIRLLFNPIDLRISFLLGKMERTKSQPLNEWRSYFATAVDTDIFSIIEHAIKVAASDHPQDFILHKDRIVARLSSIRSSHDDEESHEAAADQGSKESDATPASGEKVLSVLFRRSPQYFKEEIFQMIKDVFENNEEKENETLLNNSLMRLAMMTMTVEILEATKIGKIVNGLKSHKSKDIRDFSKVLVGNWKDLVNRQFPTQSCEKQASTSGEKKGNAVRIKIIKKKQQVEDVKPDNKAANNSGDKKQCLNDEAAVEAKIELTKRKLHESYEQIENKKKQRKVQVLAEHELPKQGGRLQTAANRKGKKTGTTQGRISSKLQNLKKQQR